MRFVSLVTIFALMLSACGDEITTKATPRVKVQPNVEMKVQPKVVLGASIEDGAKALRFDWTLVTSPVKNKVALIPTGTKSDVVNLLTANLPGLYILAVTVTDENNSVSDPGFIYVTLLE